MFGSLRRRWLAMIHVSDEELRDQLVGIAAMVGVPVSWASAAINVVLAGPPWTVVLNVVAGLVILGMWVYARMTGRYRLTYLVAVGTMFLVLFPALFFAGGGYRGGMPTFFLFAIVFTAFILDGRALRILVPLEGALYTGSILVAYFLPETVTPPTSELSWAIDAIFAVLAGGIALAVALRLFIGVYQRNKDQLTQRNAELARGDQAKTEFLAMVAHELNTPLTVIRAHADESERALRGRTEADPAQARNLSLIKAEAERLARLVNQLLDLSRIEDGPLGLRLSEHNLDTIVQQTLQTYGPTWAQYGNTIRVERGGASPTVRVDRERVVQVLVNLLSNASRHTRQGSITVGVHAQDGFAELSVADTGTGIEPEILEELGERPLRGSAAGLRSSRDSGLGVGLVITKHIVTSHGGALTIESVPGSGTTVRCTFPLAGTETQGSVG